VRHWQWTGKGRDSGDMVVHVQICRLGEAGMGGGWGVGVGIEMERGERVGIWLCTPKYAVWVVAKALVLEWKGGEGGDTVVHVQIQVRKAGGWWMSMRGWCWNGKGGEDGDTVMCVRICRFGAGVGGGHACWKM